MLTAKKITAIAFFALLLALLGVVLAQTAQETADINNVFEIVVNNTNLAPTIEAEMPGTGERITGTNYTNPLYPIQILLYAHADSVAQTSDIELYVDGTMVSSVSSKPVGAAPEQNNKSIVMIIPKNSVYKALFTNYHHYEWREYPILSGKNGTISINQTITGINQSQLDTKVNKTGDHLSGLFYLPENEIFQEAALNFSKDGLSYERIVSGFGVPDKIMWLSQFDLFTYFTDIDMGMNYISNMSDPLLNQDAATKNYVDTNNNLKVNKTGDVMTGTLSLTTSLNTFYFYTQSGYGNGRYSTIRATDVGGFGVRNNYDFYSNSSSASFQMVFFRNSNTTGNTGLVVNIGNNSNTINSILGGNIQTYFDTQLKGVAIGKSSATTGYELDINGKILTNNNITMSNTASCIQMKNNTGINYRIEVIGTVLTATSGLC